MSHEQSLPWISSPGLRDVYGPTSRISLELPDWLEYLTDIDCPERPRTRPGAVWWE